MRRCRPSNRCLSLLLLVLAAVPASAWADPPPARPNVLFVLIDDMGYADLTCYGDRRVHTDQIDRIAAEGIRFTQFYVNAPICSPSRTALLTGQYPARWRITSYLEYRAVNHRRGMADWLDPKAPSIARDLRAAGYATGHFGKWHMGGQRDVGDAPLITAYGFDTSLTTFEGLGDRVLPVLDAYDGSPPKRYALGSDTLGHGNITWVERSKVTTRFVDAAIAFMRQSQAAGKPFYVDVWPDDVHSPFFPPKALRGDDTKKQLYLGVVQATDDQLKPLFDFVRGDPRLRDNTLIVVASDNGPEPGAGSAGTFKGHKGNLYEGGIREPLIVWGPTLLARSALGTVDDHTVVAGMDVRPSILSLVGSPLKAGDADGEDLSAALVGRARRARSGPIFWIRPPDRPGPARDPFPDLAVRDGDWKLLVNEDGSAPQLYDLARDANETRNVADANRDVVDRLRKAVLGWRATLPQLPVHRPAQAEPNPPYLRRDDG